MAEKTKKTQKPNHNESNQSNTSNVTVQERINKAVETAKRRPFIPVLIILVAVALAVGAVQFYNWYVVATVDGEMITRPEYVEELENAAGQQVLEGLITRTIIEQEAQEKGIAVTEEEINQEITELEQQVQQQGQSLDQLLSFQGLDREGLREQIRIQKQVEKLAGNDVQVATDEIEAFIEENQDLAAEDVDLEELQQQAEQQLRQQKIDQKIQQLIQQLRQDAAVEFNIDRAEQQTPQVQQ
ncbi:MAG: SurA N-terminal domain-containing protein [Patescibacteria group bacterium]